MWTVPAAVINPPFVADFQPLRTRENHLVVPTAVLAVRDDRLAATEPFKVETVATDRQFCLDEIVHPERFEKPPIDTVSMAGWHTVKEVEVSGAVDFVGNEHGLQL